MSIYYDLKRKSYLNILGAVVSALATLLFLRNWWMLIGAVIFLTFSGFGVIYRIKANREFETS
ncbi:MAG: hypothetical protein ACQETE_11175 [Bacteroidota bacterium]